MTLTPMAERDLRAHCMMIINLMKRGTLIPFLGAGVNLSNRPPGIPFTLGGTYLPDAAELSASIANDFGYTWSDKSLLRVAWHASFRVGEGHFYRYLYEIFSSEKPSTDVHRFFARARKKLADKGHPNRHQVIITTNYDELLERAFADEGEPYDLLTYVARGDERDIGKFRYVPHDHEPKMIYDPNTEELPLDRTIIIKIHGAVAKDWESSSFVVTEDDYIGYLARMNANSHIPSLLLAKMLPSSFLFLGHSLADWNLRVFLHSIQASRRFNNSSFAVMKDPEEWDETYWRKHNVELTIVSLRDYITILNEELDALS